jgi:hypothetical protein
MWKAGPKGDALQFDARGPERKPSSGDVSAARQAETGKTSTAPLQNGQNEPHYHGKGATATSYRNMRLTRRDKRARLPAEGEARNGNPAFENENIFQK